jgi:pimeloyl-ACP methyl ester carboxylesterase
VYAYDRRGRGQSGDAPEYAVEREIENLQAVIEEAGGSAAVFAGSTGANVALQAALAGTPIAKLALHEPFFRVEGFPKPPSNSAETLRVILEEGDRRDEAAEFTGSWPKPIPAGTALTSPNLCQTSAPCSQSWGVRRRRCR